MEISKFNVNSTDVDKFLNLFYLHHDCITSTNRFQNWAFAIVTESSKFNNFNEGRFITTLSNFLQKYGKCNIKYCIINKHDVEKYYFLGKFSGQKRIFK